MPSANRQIPSSTPVVPFTPRKREPTLEELGILPGSRLLATPEEQTEQERQQAERAAAANAHMDNVLAAMWSCRACGVGNAFGSSSGLCVHCRTVVQQLHAEQAMSDVVNGTPRRQLCEEYLARAER